MLITADAGNASSKLFRGSCWAVSARPPAVHIAPLPMVYPPYLSALASHPSTDMSSTATTCASVLGVGASLWLAGLSVGRVSALLCLAQVGSIFALRLGSCEAGALAMAPVFHLAVACALQLVPFAASDAVILSISLAICVSAYLSLVRMPRRPLPSMEGRVVIVTGCTTGIGLETAHQLLVLGATVVFACRNESRAQLAMLEASCGARGRAVFLGLDLSDCESVRTCAAAFCKDFPRCDALVCNAGAQFTERTLSAQGWEQNMASNHLGHWLLIKL